ncbi:hypothetical protein IIB79_06485 [candidate division KSB1 bacterium]|nr:hypothetical protein [candidate division KSB1 bacterium]
MIRANTGRFRLQRISSPRIGVSMPVRIRDDLKAGGSLPDNFSAGLTPKGIKINLTA